MSPPRYKWQPSTADIAKAAGIPVEEVIRFDHNTSPVGTVWTADLVAEAATHLNEYPGADYRPIREAAAMASGLPPDHVAIGAGVDELLLLVARAFLRPDSASVMITPTYPLYRIATYQAGAHPVEVPTTGPDFAFPIDLMVEAVDGADVTWVCVPSNPTGNAVADDVVAAIIDSTKGLVVLDAAYAEFAGQDWSPWVERHPRLLVLHTLSKAYGLAGIRVGFGLGHPDLIDALDGVRPPGSIASLSVELAAAALSSPERMRRNVAEVCAARTDLGAALESIGLRVLPSEANFLLTEVGSGARALGDDLMDEGLVVRMFPGDGPLASYLRFTVRSPGENARLVDALRRRLP